MAGPWEKYAQPQAPAAGKPWEKYAQPQAAAPAAPLAMPAGPQGWGDILGGLAAALFDGGRQGTAMLVGAPADLMNNAPRVANLLPGVEGVGPMTENPVGGRDSIDTLLRAGGLLPDFEPRTAAERIVNRAGEELGSTAVPVAGLIGRASTMPLATVNRMASTPTSLGQSIAGQFLQPAAVAPAALAGREAAYAAAAGTGAGLANEVAGSNQGALSDFAGSLGGALTLGAGTAAGGALANLAAGALGRPAMMNGVAGEVVADRLINNSTRMQEQFATTGNLDTDGLASSLRVPAAVEDAVPGYRANIGDRAGDPGLTTFAFNQDAVSPGAANARRVNNEIAVNETMASMTPDGDAARFRADLSNSVDQQIADALAAEQTKRASFDGIVTALEPTLGTATMRGSNIRAGLSDAERAAREQYRQLYAPINEADAPVDIGPLREVFGQIDQGLPMNDAARFRPPEAAIPGQLAPEGSATVPLKEVTSMRGGLTQDIRRQTASGERQAARVGGQYKSALDEYLEANLPPELKAQLDAANASRRDVADRFERPGTGIADALRPREGGGYALDDSAVPSRFAQPDQGNLNDLRSLLREAGSDPRVRNGLADEVASDIKSKGLLDKPEQLQRYMADRSVLLSEFPELAQKLDVARGARTDLTAAERAAKDTQTRLTTPGRSAPASYLKYADEASVNAIRTVTNSPKPREAVQELLKTANTPTARQDLRAALWGEVSGRGKMDAPGVTGETRWNGKKLRAMFDDPKFAAVAEELWADDPQDLANIRKVFDALATAEGSGRARAVGSSGTAQALSGKFDPALSTSSIASRARSVNRGQLSPTIAVVDVLSTWLRNKSAQVQSRAIDNLASTVVNNPGMAADLLEKYNPATAAARRAMLTQKYGVRATQLLNVLDEAENEDPVVDAVSGGN
jgi:hypothetical protein